METQNIARLKKYLFMISMFFVFIIGGHILYLYFYDDAKEEPILGGNISEGIIGDFPHLNPLIPSNDYNKNIINLLYRSLLSYDYEENKVIGDLAECNIENLAKIECHLKDDIYWSNGEKITPQDVLSTYNILKNSDINPSFLSLIKETTFEVVDDTIIFKNSVRDITFLNVLFQPIVAKEVLDGIGNKELYGKFNPVDGFYSGPYKVFTVSYDDSLGVQKLILEANEFFTQYPRLISRYTYKIFKDQAHFLKHKDLVNIFYDKNKIIGETLPRLNQYSYTLNQYTTLFLNTEGLKNSDFRNFILSKIDQNNIIKTLGKGFKQEGGLFLDDTFSLNYENNVNFNIEETLKQEGFFKKELLLDLSIEKNLGEQSEIISNDSLKYITKPINKKYSFIGDESILIEGTIGDKNPSDIYINDYKLSGYKPGDKSFFYRLQKDFQNIFPGQNKYSIYFTINGKKEHIEDFFITYSSEEEKLTRLQKEFEENLKLLEEKASQPIEEEEKEKILSLDDNFYYNLKYQKYTLRLYYIDNKEDILQSANIIKNSLETYGIAIELFPISIIDLGKKISLGEKDYDILILGLDSGFFPHQIYPYFHSGQAKNGYNFSNIKDLSLDLLLEETKAKVFNKDDLDQVKEKIFDLIQKQSIIKPLYKKESYVLVDNNIKNFTLPKQIPSDLAINNALLHSYIMSEKSIDFSQKTFQGFFHFIKNIFSYE